ncbi:MAG: nuclease-related domain-containing protein [Chloroflexota bacterium]|nr:nuclease-related domain-containing protein [Chloroflexota bacterium]
MRNVAPTLSLNRRANQWKSYGFLVIALGAFLTAVGVLLNVVPLVGRTDPAFGLYSALRTLVAFAGVALLLVGVGLLVRAFTWRKDNDLAQMTAQALRASFDDRYTFIRNVSKRELGYIDAVMVGPAGVLVFRIVDAEGDWANENANWLIKKSATGEYLPAPFNPTQQALDDIQKLDTSLRAIDVNGIPIFGVVVFTKDERRIKLSARDSALPISHLGLLTVNLANGYLAADRINMNTATQVVKLLYGA